MIIQTQPLPLHHLPSIIPTSHFPKPISIFPLKSLRNQNFSLFSQTPLPKTQLTHLLKCSTSVSELTQSEFLLKPTPAEVSRTIMELSCSGTLSTVTQDGWPLSAAVQVVVDHLGTPVLCLSGSSNQFLRQAKSSLHVQLEQRGLRTTQCMLQGSLSKPEDKILLEKLSSIWKKRFEEDVDENHLCILSVERVLQIEDLKKDGVWVTSLEYKTATPDPLRDFAEKIVNEINMNHMEDFERICNIYLNIGFQVADANLIWVDRLGFDVHIRSPRNEIFEARIPFPREVSDEKGVKSTFNCMSQHAWEVDRSYTQPDFEKSKALNQIR